MPGITKIAVDVMGADLGVTPIITACIKFAQTYKHLKLVLVGDKAQITPYVNSNNVPNIELYHTPNFISMFDVPVQIIRHKVDYSMRCALQLVAQKQCCACITSANTGALVLLARQILGMQDNILRPALAVSVPTLTNDCWLLDVGATLDAKPAHLHQFAYLSKTLTKQTSPTIALLNIGVEDYKGTSQIKATAKLLAQDPNLNFMGFIESNGVYQGLADVVICDGFNGNLFLKTSAAAINFMAHQLNYTLPNYLQPNNYNAAMLLGVNDLVIKAHGASCAPSFYATLEYVAKLKNNL